MADNWLNSFAVALGFEVNTASLNAAKKSLADYEKAVKEAEKRIEDARWAGAKTEEEIAKLARETNLKEARAALAAAQEREKSEKETARKREERNKEFMSGLSKAALAATAAATAISYAVSRVASAFDNLGFVSQRTGASVQGLNSLAYAFKQTGGSAQQAIGFVEKFAQAIRNNDGLKEMLESLGVDTTQSTENQAVATVEALSKHEYQVGSREAGLFGISEEDYKLVTDHLRQIREYRDEYNRTTRSLGIDSQKATEASQSFWRSLNKLQATASALTDKLMISLAPALEAIVKRFNDWIEAHPEQVNKILTDISNAMVAIATKFGEFADWMVGDGGDRLIQRWDEFAKRVERVARGVEIITKVAGFVIGNGGVREYGGAHGDPGKTATILNEMSRQQTTPDNRKWYEKVLPKSLGGKDDPRVDRSSGVAANPGAYKEVLDHIARSEGTANRPGGGYSTSLDFGRWLPGRSEKDLTKLTLNQIDELQSGMLADPANRAKYGNGLGSSAIGRYQIVRKTLRGLRRQLGLSGDQLFDAAMQDRLGATLARARGANAAGLQNEWASLVGARNAIAVDLMRRVNPGAATMPAPISPSSDAGRFDPNNIDPKNLMPPAPGSASPTTNNSTSNRSVHQTINSTTTFNNMDRPKEAARVMESAFGRMHGLALANAQSAVA